MSNEPRYPFGYGLSYTTFAYSDIHLSSTEMSVDGELTATVTVTYTGSRDGAEVVQLYIRDLVGSVTRPVKELKGFEKIYLKAGESRKVSFSITPELLKFYNSVSAAGGGGGGSIIMICNLFTNRATSM